MDPGDTSGLSHGPHVLGRNPLLFFFRALSQQNQPGASSWDLAKLNTNGHTSMPMTPHELGVSGYTTHVSVFVL